MNKENVFRSSEFFMSVGDILHILIIDESGDPVTLTLVGEEIANDVPNAPVANAASDILSTSFTANCNLMENSIGYFLDVATDSAFTSFVAGYNNKDLGVDISDSVVGLTDATVYFYRFRAYNNAGTSISSNVIQTTTAIENVADSDGNVYTYVTIGTQQWMVENLKTTKYADSTPIPNLTLDADWIAEDGTIGHDGAYCYYDNDIANKADYGALYNWYAVDNMHGLAPTGWRVPSDADFATLIAFLGGSAIGGGKLKEEGLVHWNTPNLGATDEYGFKGVGTGYRLTVGSFDFIKEFHFMWTSTNSTVANAIYRWLYFDGTQIGGGTEISKIQGFSVRCMRDVV